MMRKLNFLPLQGSVNLIDPELSIWTVFYYQRIRDSSSLIPEGDSVENHQLQRVFIGRLVANGGMRDVRYFFSNFYRLFCFTFIHFSIRHLKNMI